jgi:hypothetical protein
VYGDGSVGCEVYGVGVGSGSGGGVGSGGDGSGDGDGSGGGVGSGSGSSFLNAFMTAGSLILHMNKPPIVKIPIVE